MKQTHVRGASVDKPGARGSSSMAVATAVALIYILGILLLILGALSWK